MKTLIQSLPHSNIRPIDGALVRSMMRRNHVTIRSMAIAANVPQRVVRQWRAVGAPAGLRAWEVLRAIEAATLTAGRAILVDGRVYRRIFITLRAA